MFEKFKELFKSKPKVQQDAQPAIIIIQEGGYMSKHDKKKEKRKEDVAPPLPPTPEPERRAPVVQAVVVEAIAEVSKPPVVEPVAEVKMPPVVLPVKEEPKQPVIQPEKKLSQGEYDVLMSAVETYILSGALPTGSLARLKQQVVVLSDAEKERMSNDVTTNLIDSHKIERIENPTKYNLCLLGAISSAVVLTALVSKYTDDGLQAGAVATAATLVGAKAYSSQQTNSVVDQRRDRFTFFHKAMAVPKDKATPEMPRNGI